MRLVLISTSSNQSYIFASNRLREAVGASYLVACSTTKWIDEACGRARGTRLQASSGNALITTPDECARQLVREVTLKALQEAPGLSITGVSIEIAGATPTADEISKVFEEWQRHFGRTAAGASARFHRLPVVAACGSTDWPAACWHSDLKPGNGTYPEDEEPIPLSAEVIAKRAVRHNAEARIRKLAGTDNLARIRDFFSAVEWVGVVHADGNGLGQLFRDAPGKLTGGPNPAGAALGQLSDEVRARAESAFQHAVATVTANRDHSDAPLPLVPLIVGGDDLTLLIDGKLALEFTTAYLEAFGKPVGEDSMLRQVLGDHKALTACAGVALVKPRFPFSEAYRLADELCRSAKREVRGNGMLHGLDVHVLLDSQAGSLEKLRSTLQSTHGSLTNRPYLIPARGGVAVPPQKDWEQVRKRVQTVGRKPSEGAVITRTQLHHLREELRADHELALRRLATLRERATSDEDRERLEALCPGDRDPLTSLYDLLDLEPFVGGSQ